MSASNSVCCESCPSTRPRLASWIHAIFLGLAVGFWIWAQIFRPELFKTSSIIFVAIFLEALPFVLLGSVLGGLIEVFISRDRILALLPKNRYLTPLIAGLLGILVPVCECGVVVVVRRLMRKGLPQGAAIAYLLAGPIVNFVVGASTAVAYSFQWKVVLLRMLFGYVIAVCVAISLEFVGASTSLVTPSLEESTPESLNPPRRSFFSNIRLALVHAAEDFLDISRFLVMGAFLASLFQTLVSREAFMTSIMSTPAISILAMMLLAFLLNLCSEADAFVAASFQGLGMTLSAQMAFMIMGPMLDVKLLSMYFGVFRKRAIVLMVGFITLFVFLAMILMEALAL